MVEGHEGGDVVGLRVAPVPDVLSFRDLSVDGGVVAYSQRVSGLVHHYPLRHGAVARDACVSLHHRSRLPSVFRGDEYGCSRGGLDGAGLCLVRRNPTPASVAVIRKVAPRVEFILSVHFHHTVQVVVALCAVAGGDSGDLDDVVARAVGPSDGVLPALDQD